MKISIDIKVERWPIGRLILRVTEREGKRIFWYPDRKHFLLGRYITDQMLADMTVAR